MTIAKSVTVRARKALARRIRNALKAIAGLPLTDAEKEIAVGELLEAMIEAAALASFPKHQRRTQAPKRVKKAKASVLQLLTRRTASPYPAVRQ